MKTPWSEYGFQFKDETELQEEFKIAQVFFSDPKNSSQVKLSRQAYEYLPQYHSILSYQALENVSTENKPILKHSYLKLSNGQIVAIASNKGGNVLGAGAFARVKNALFANGNRCVLKIEKYSEYRSLSSSLEGKISADVGLLMGETVPVHRGYVRRDKATLEKSTHKKFYSTMHYLGKSVKDTLIQDPNISLAQKLIIARKAAWEVHKLHMGILSKTGEKYAHRDLKPANITIDEHGRVYLIDYGFAEKMYGYISNYFVGSNKYMPIEDCSLDNPDYNFYNHLFKDLGLATMDTFALKKTLYMGRNHTINGDCIFSDDNYNALSQPLKTLLNAPTKTSMDVQIYSRNGTPLKIAFYCIQEQMNYHPNNDSITNQDMIDVCACFEFLDEQPTPQEIKKYEDVIKNVPAAHQINSLLSTLNDKSMDLGPEQITQYKNAILSAGTDYQKLDKLKFDLAIIKDKLTDITTSSKKFGLALAALSPEQRTSIISIRRFMNNMVMAAFNAEINALASALMSDDNKQIKAQFDHLILNSKTPVGLITALSNIEPRWMEKINIAAGLGLSANQLTYQPDVEKVLKQYIQIVLQDRNNATQHYKDMVNSIRGDHASATADDNKISDTSYNKGTKI